MRAPEMAPSAAPLTELSGRQKAVILGSVMVGLFVAAMDQTVVSTALPRVVAELRGLNLYSWVFTAYMLTSTALVPIIGKLGDMYGRKPLFMIGIIVFMVASVFTGAAQTIEQLVVMRGLQGIGAGFIMANSFTIIGDLFPPSERGKYTGLFSGVFGLASVTGPFIGGYLTDEISWRWVFYVNLPIGLIALPALYFGLPGRRGPRNRHSLDILGSAALVAATVPFLLACVWVGEQRYGLTSPVTLGLFAISAAMPVAFVLIESRAKEPVLPLGIFRNAVVSLGTVNMFVTGIAMFGVISFVPLFVQGALGASATRSGSVTMPMTIAMVVTSLLAGQAVSRMGRYKWQGVLGSVFVTLGIFLLSRMTVDTSGLEVSLNMVVMGLGIGMGMPVFTVAVQNAVPHRLLGVVSASSQFFRQMGGMLGVAILGAALTARLSDEIPRTMPESVRSGTPPDLLARAEDPQTMLNPVALGRLRESFEALGPDGARLFAEALERMRAALATALSGVFLTGAGLMLIAVLSALLMPEIPLRRTVHGEGEGMPRPAEDGLRAAPAGAPPGARPRTADTPGELAAPGQGRTADD